MSEEESHGYILGPGSTCGFSFEHNYNEISFNIEHFASRVDWRMLFSCLKGLLDQGNGELSKDDESTKTVDLTEAGAIKYAEHNIKKAIIRSRRELENKDGDDNSKSMAIPVNDFNINISLNQLPEEHNKSTWNKLENELCGQTTTYGPVHHAKQVVHHMTDGNQKVSNYHHLPTIIRKDTDFITMNGITRSIDELLPLKETVNILGSIVTDLGISYFFPEINFHEEDELFESLYEIRRATPKTLSDDLAEENDALEERVRIITAQVIDQFQSGKKESEITLQVCSEEGSDEIDKDIARLTIDAFKLITKDITYQNNLETLIDPLINMGHSEDIISLAIIALHNNIRQLNPKDVTKSDELSGDADWVIITLIGGIIILGGILLIFFGK